MKRKLPMKEDEELSEREEADKITTETPKLNQKNKRRKQDKEAMKFLRPKPNFFLAFQIYDAGIHQKVKKVQEAVVAKTPTLHSALVDISTLHVTLAVTHLADEKDIKSFKEKLDEWATENVNNFFGEPVTLSFTGIKTFRNIVAYLDMEPSTNREKVFELSKGMNNLLSSAGLWADKKPFQPHVTFLKLSKDHKLLKARKTFHDDFELLKNCTEYFGKQEISSIQLLSMDKEKDEKGYYKCFHQIFVSDPRIEMDHSDCCSPIQKPEVLGNASTTE